MQRAMPKVKPRPSFRWLNGAAIMGPVVKTRHNTAGGLVTQKWKNGMNKRGTGRHTKPKAKAPGKGQMLKIGFIYRLWVLGKQAGQ
ncbi:MAG: hypothetical protein ACI8TF_002296 [Paracoccaceae bacterium]|jgi:hypothetical protein